MVISALLKTRFAGSLYRQTRTDVNQSSASRNCRSNCLFDFAARKNGRPTCVTLDTWIQFEPTSKP